MPQPQTRNKSRKRTPKKRPAHGKASGRAYAAKSNRRAKQLRRNEARSRVPEMPGEQQRRRTPAKGEDFSIAVSPTGTQQHQPQARRAPRLAKSRAKSPSVGRTKSGRTAKKGR